MPDRRLRRRFMIRADALGRRDTHFRISYAASDATIERGLEVLAKIRQ